MHFSFDPKDCLSCILVAQKPIFAVALTGLYVEGQGHKTIGLFTHHPLPHIYPHNFKMAKSNIFELLPIYIDHLNLIFEVPNRQIENGLYYYQPLCSFMTRACLRFQSARGY